MYHAVYLADFKELLDFIEQANELRHEIIGFVHEGKGGYAVIYKSRKTHEFI
jgi:hypothetical protein